MDSLEAMHRISPARTFWNSDDPFLDPFDETLMPTMPGPLEAACSSTFLFPSTVTSSGDSGGSQVFKTEHSLQPSSIFFDELSIPVEETAAGSSRDSPLEFYHSGAFQFSWLPASPAPPAPPPRHFSQGGQARGELNHCGGSQLIPDLFGPLNTSTTSSTALDSGHGLLNHATGPPLRLPSFSRPHNTHSLKQQHQHQLQQRNAVKSSWQSASMFELPRRVLSHKETPLGSPSSVISGFTKVVDRFVSTDYAVDVSSSSFGRSTSAAAPTLDDVPVKYASHSQESRTPEGRARCMTGSQEIAVKQLTTKRKRKRSRPPKRSADKESQRMTHITVERNRRKQMNQHLATLRALMPASFVQKSDQASIVGGTIEFVKELEHLLHCLQSQKRRRAYSDLSTAGTPTSRFATPNPDSQLCQLQPPFAFHSPQRLVYPSPILVGATLTESINGHASNRQSPHQLSGSYAGPGPLMWPVPASSSSTLIPWDAAKGGVGEARSSAAAVEVKLVSVMPSNPRAALVKIMATRRAGQLLRTVVALESLALAVMHTNVTTVGHTVLYSFHVHIGARCCMNVDEIARAIHQTFASLHALQF